MRLNSLQFRDSYSVEFKLWRFQINLHKRGWQLRCNRLKRWLGGYKCRLNLLKAEKIICILICKSLPSANCANLDCAGWRGGAIWATAGGDPGAAWYCCQWCQEAYGWFQQENALVSGFDPHNVQAAGFYTVESVVYAPKKKLMEIKVKTDSNWMSKVSLFLNMF